MAIRPKEKHPFSICLPSSSKPSLLLHRAKLLLTISLLLSLWLLLLLDCLPTTTTTTTTTTCDPDIAPFYIYDLPDRFNAALLRRCRTLSPYTDMCPHLSHHGLGRLLRPSWHATHQFLAEVIFHASAARHPCRVLSPSSARLFYVPFYAGLHASAHLLNVNHTLRDALPSSLLRHLPGTHQKNHFFAIGRTSWDFMRQPNTPPELDFGANHLLTQTGNAQILTVERNPWKGQNQHGIPYPSYFHPRNKREMLEWQETVTRSERTHLYAFIGGKRIGVEKAAARDEILRQCMNESSRCLRVECSPGAEACHDPDRVMAVLKRSDFCMQPPGDSFTRRSVFDSVLAGCVPVFFSEHTAYTQYEWYSPPAREEWSVMIEREEWGRIGEVLGRVPREEVRRMRERVVGMIPAVTYAHPEARRSELGFRDAVDVALVES